MKKRGKLKKAERLELAILRNKGYGVRAIARVMDRHHTTISREIARNSERVSGIYDPHKAQHKAYVKKKYARFEWKKINQHKDLKAFIIACLKKHWNPDEIAGYMKTQNTPFYASKTAIYEWLYSTHGLPYCHYLYTRRYTKKRRVEKTVRSMISNRIPIQQRSRGANNRTRYGHLEVDTIVSGKNGSGALLVCIDRKSRYLTIDKLASLKPEETQQKLGTLIAQRCIRSCTFDNGIENRHHEQLRIPTFFCDPYSSWQKGSIEHANKMIRRYIPKGTDISRVAPSFIEHIIDIINKKPRRILGFKSAYDVMMEKQLLKGSGAIGG